MKKTLANSIKKDIVPTTDTVNLRYYISVGETRVKFAI